MLIMGIAYVVALGLMLLAIYEVGGPPHPPPLTPAAARLPAPQGAPVAG